MNNFKRLSFLFCLIAVFCMVLSLSGCKKTKNDDEQLSDGTYNIDDSSDIVVSDDGSSAEELTDSSDETISSEETPSGSDTPSGSVQLPVTTNPVTGNEILGSGTKDNPYLELPVVSDTYMSVTTVTIPAGSSVHYGIQRVVGTILTIENANAYVVYNDKRYDANGSKVSFEVVDAKALASDNIKFEIGNKGSAPASFTLIFTNKTGSREAPSPYAMGSNVTVALEAENGVGHYYKYVSERAGKIRFSLSGTADSVISITNNATSKNIMAEYSKTKAQLTDPDNGDAVVQFVELEVSAGDEIIINVGTMPNKRGKYAANTITWSAAYAA